MTSAIAGSRLTPDLDLGAIAQASFSCRRTRGRFGKAIEKMFSSKVHLAISYRGGGAERVIQMIHRQGSILTVVAEDHGGPIAAGHVDAPSGTHGRRKDEVPDALEPERLALERA